MALRWVLRREQKFLRRPQDLLFFEIDSYLIGQRDEAGVAVLSRLECREPVVKVDVPPAEIGDLAESEAHRGGDEDHAVEMGIFALFATSEEGVQFVARKKAVPAGILLQFRDFSERVLVDPLPLLGGEGESPAKTGKISIHRRVRSLFLPERDAAEKLLFCADEERGGDFNQGFCPVVLIPPIQMRGLISQARGDFAEVEAGVLLHKVSKGVFARLVVEDVLSVKNGTFDLPNPVLGVCEGAEGLAEGFCVFATDFSVEAD